MIFSAGGPEEVVQPIPFNHKLHVESDIQCSECHFRCEKNRDEDGDVDCSGCEESEFFFCEDHLLCPDHKLPGLPGLEVCAGCHDADEGDEPSKAVLATHLTEGKEIPWRRITRLPSSNVYFSHRRHAILGKIPCSECHGVVEEMTEPPRVPPVDLSMDGCLECHHESDESEGCVGCHR